MSPSSSSDALDGDSVERLRALEEESTALRASVFSANDALRSANERAAALEGLLMETEAEALVMKKRADEADVIAVKRLEQMSSTTEMNNLRVLQAEKSKLTQQAQIEELEVALRDERDARNALQESIDALQRTENVEDAPSQAEIQHMRAELNSVRQKLVEATTSRDAASSEARLAIEQLRRSEAEEATTQQDLSRLQLEMSQLKERLQIETCCVEQLSLTVDDFRLDRNQAILALCVVAEERKTCLAAVAEIGQEHEAVSKELRLLSTDAKRAIERAGLDAADEISKAREEYENSASRLRENLRVSSEETESMRQKIGAVAKDADVREKLIKERHAAQVEELRSTISTLREELDSALGKYDKRGEECERLERTVKERDLALDRETQSKKLVEIKMQKLEQTGVTMRAKLEESGTLLTRAANEGHIMSQKTQAAVAEAALCRKRAETQFEAAKQSTSNAFAQVSKLGKDLEEIVEGCRDTNPDTNPKDISEAVAYLSSLLDLVKIDMENARSSKEATKKFTEEIESLISERELLKASCKRLGEERDRSAQAAKCQLQAHEESRAAEATSLADVVFRRDEKIRDLQATLQEQERAAEVTLTSLQRINRDLETVSQEKQSVVDSLHERLEENAKSLAMALEEKELVDLKLHDALCGLKEARERLDAQSTESQGALDISQAQIALLREERTSEEKRLNQLLEIAVTKVEKLQCMNLELQTFSDAQIQQCEQLKVEAASLYAENDSLRTNFNDAVQKNTSLESRVREESREKEAALLQASQGELCSAKLREEVALMNTTHGLEKSELVTELKNSVSDVDALKKDMAISEEKERSIQSLLDASANELSLEREKCNNLHKEVLAVRQELANLTAKLGNVESKLLEVQQVALHDAQAFMSSEEKCRKLMLDCSNVRQELTKSQAEIECARQKFAQVSLERSSLATTFEAYKEDSEAQRKRELDLVAEEQVKAVADAVAQTEASHAQAVTSMTQMNDTVRADLEKKLFAIQERKKSDDHAAAERTCALQKQSTEAEENVRRLVVKLENANHSIGELKKERDCANVALNETILKNSAYSSEVANIKGQLDESADLALKAEERAGLREQAIAKLSSNVDAMKSESDLMSREHIAICKEMEKRIDALNCELMTAKDAVLKAKEERNSAQNQLDYLQSRTLVSIRGELDSRAKDVLALESELASKTSTVECLTKKIAESQIGVQLASSLREKLELGESLLAEKTQRIGELQQASDRYEDQVSELRKALSKLKETCSERISVLEESVKQKDIGLTDIQSRLESITLAWEKEKELASAVSAKCSPREKEFSETRSSMGQELLEALDKYDSTLQKCNRLRKRSKRYEALLTAEREKTAKLRTTSHCEEKAPEKVIDDRDLKRQVSPSSKGRSPLMKRVRETRGREIVSSPSASRPPLAPRNF